MGMFARGRRAEPGRPTIFRRAGEEHGFTVIEVMVSLTILGVAVFALISVSLVSLKATSRARLRESAIAEMTNQTEFLRANGYGNVQLKPNSGLGGTAVPATVTHKGKTYATVVGTAPCVTCFPYQKRVQSNGSEFLVTTVIAKVDDLADGEGGGDADANTTDYKKILITVASEGVRGFTYTTETIVHDTTSDPGYSPIQGVRIALVDEDGMPISDEGLDFTVTIASAGVVAAEVHEGEYSNLSMETGGHTCAVSNTGSTAVWHPLGSSSNSESFPCPVTSQETTTYTRVWTDVVGCPAAAVAGGLVIAVNDSDGATGPLSGAAVDPAPLDGQTTDPATMTTGLDGTATFPVTSMHAGRYALSISKPGYESQTVGEVCVYKGLVVTRSVSLVKDTATPTATIETPITWTGKGNGVFRLVALGSAGTDVEIAKGTWKKAVLSVPIGTYAVQVYCKKGDAYNLKATLSSATYPSGATTTASQSFGGC